MKKGSLRRGALAAAMLAALVALLLGGCGGTKALHCDRCGKEVRVPADSNMDADWILYCADCEKELGLDKLPEE